MLNGLVSIMYIGVIPVVGTINMRLYSKMKGIIEYAAQKNKVGAVIIHINSSGGEAVASELFYNSFRKVAMRKPLYAYIEGMGASGAYWVSLAASKIYAFSGSIIGSIGVVSIIPKISRLMEKLGIDIQSIKIGEYKDALSPFSTDSQYGIDMINRIMKESYEKFVSTVRERRNISEEDLKRIAQGQLFSVSESINEKLIDSVGTFEETIKEVSKTIRGVTKFKRLEPAKPFMQRMMEGAMGDSPIQSLLSMGNR